MCVHIPRIKLMGTGWILREKIKNSSSGVRVLHMTSNLIIARRCQDENGKEMNQNVKRTCRACRAIVFLLIKLLFCGVLRVVVVLAYGPYYITDDVMMW